MLKKSLTATAFGLTILSAAAIAAVPAVQAEQRDGHMVVAAACNPCAAKKNACNPCNPCAAKKNACNPCNPCAAKKNPCKAS